MNQKKFCQLFYVQKLKIFKVTYISVLIRYTVYNDCIGV